VNARTSKGWTPLHHAARFGHTEAVRYLLRMGAIPHSRTNDRGNKTPMQMAVDGNHIDIALLLGYRPRPNQR
jgi:ankyrin